MKKKLAVVLAVVLLIASCFGFSSCSKEGDGTFTWLLSKGVGEEYMSSYNENPVVKYLLSKEYNGNKLDIDFKTMVSGSETDQFQTMISTGDYYDVMDIAYSSYSIEALYELGVALDLTEYVEKYMPNYLAFINSHDELKMNAYTIIDGEKKMIQLVAGGDEKSVTFCGYMYRRDWIVKYGTNPQTSEPFTGGYSAKNADGTNDVNSWSDNIVFPSWYLDNEYVTEYKANHPDWDGTDPVFISDWEWMFEIFEKAFADLGVTDSYMMSVYYPGFLGTGDLFSSFGGGAPGFSLGEDGVYFSATSDTMLSYLECMRNWYEKGWLDNAFYERSSDMFYKIDSAAVAQGEVPMILSGQGNIGNSIETEQYPLTEGVMFMPTRLPINDVYGKDSTKGQEPDCLYQSTYKNGSVIVTSNVSEKDLPTLLTFIDSLYTDEGMLLTSLGLNKEQYEEIKDSLEKDKEGLDIYAKYGLTEGAYSVENGVYYAADVVENGGYLKQAVTNGRISVGKILNNVAVRNDVINKANKEWMIYTSTKDIINYLEFFDDEQSKTYNRYSNKINDKMYVEIPKFIKGEYNLDSDFETFAKTMNKMSPDKVSEVFNEVLKNYGIIE